MSFDLRLTTLPYHMWPVSEAHMQGFVGFLGVVKELNHPGAMQSKMKRPWELESGDLG